MSYPKRRGTPECATCGARPVVEPSVLPPPRHYPGWAHIAFYRPSDRQGGTPARRRDLCPLCATKLEKMIDQAAQRLAPKEKA